MGNFKEKKPSPSLKNIKKNLHCVKILPQCGHRKSVVFRLKIGLWLPLTVAANRNSEILLENGIRTQLLRNRAGLLSPKKATYRH